MSVVQDWLSILARVPAENPVRMAAIVVLLGMSATFSSCETALFSLTPLEINRFRAGRGTFDRFVALLARDLRGLLPTILFGNMLVNVFLYSLASDIAGAMGARYGRGISAFLGIASLFMVICFGEVFPKQLAIVARIGVARATAIPMFFLHALLRKPLSVLNACVRALERAFNVKIPKHGTLGDEELRLLIEMSRTDGVISADEFELIDGVVDLPEVKVRDIMTPRVDLVAAEKGDSGERILELARTSNHTKLPVLDSEKDDLSGWIDARDIFVDNCKGGVEGYVRKLRFYSEHDRADQVLAGLRSGGDLLAAVVDERGGVVGVITLQDIMDEVLGHFGDYGAAPPVPIRETDGGYVLAGGVSVREWRELFDVSRELPRSATVGGLVVSLLGRPAKAGDSIGFDNLEMTVLSVRRNRVTEVGVKLLAPAGGRREGDAPEGGA